MSGVLGELKKHWLSDMLGSDFMEFDTATMQGMARVDAGKVDILAVISKEPGKGHFRALIEGCKREYRQITVLQIMEPALFKVLKGYGFRRCWVSDTNGERSPGMRWKRQSAEG